jgi:uncharacterized membrane protein YfcA
VPTDPHQLAALAALVLCAAVLYSSVGHAGASAYLAAMALFGVAPPAMKPAALMINIVVAVAGSLRFGAAGLIPWRLLVPLCVGSVPAAFAGGAIGLGGRLYQAILGVTLLLAAARLALPGPAEARLAAPAAPWLAVIGAALGLLAGLTGVGGGVFLSPLLILTGLEGPRRTAGASIVFILVNSVAGLLGHLAAARTVPTGTALLAAVALVGGTYGSRLGARRLPPLAIRRLLAVVLVIAGGKLLLG